jgi:hypothetical protein
MILVKFHNESFKKIRQRLPMVVVIGRNITAVLNEDLLTLM